MLYGIDRSYANQPADWAAVATSKRVSFVYSRCCYGSNPSDDDGESFIADHDGCKANGIQFGCYFFWLAGQDALAQADHFLSVASGRYGALLPFVDVEEGSGVLGWGTSVQERVDALSTVLTQIQKHLAEPMVYTNADTWNTYFGGTDAFAGHRLFVANYPATPGQPSMPTGWDTWTLHQYKSDASDIPGISGRIDYDCLNGDTLATILR